MNKKNFTSGFTLLETLVAVFLITIAIVTFLGSAARGITTTRQALNRVNAQLLAQEGIEIVRNIRDNNAISLPPVPFATGSGILNQNFCSPSGCTFDIGSISTQTGGNCGSITSSCAKLYTSASGLYSHSAGGTLSPFSRLITITQDGTSDAAKITSTVQWLNGTSTDSVKVVSYLTNWFST